MKQGLTLSILLVMILLSGCRGQLSQEPPVHINPNMDWQPKVKAQKDPRQIPDGTVVWGRQSVDAEKASRADFLQADSVYYRGKRNGVYVSKVPVEVTDDLIQRGRERYDIYCAVCHTKSGDGTQSPISKRGWIVADIRADVSVGRSDGELYDIITNGVRTMPGYAKQVNVEDRWAIVAYVRALQKVQRGRLSDVPEEKRSELK